MSSVTVADRHTLACVLSLPLRPFGTGKESSSYWKERVGQLGGWTDRLMGGKKVGKGGWECLGELRALTHSAKLAAVLPTCSVLTPLAARIAGRPAETSGLAGPFIPLPKNT